MGTAGRKTRWPACTPWRGRPSPPTRTRSRRGASWRRRTWTTWYGTSRRRTACRRPRRWRPPPAARPADPAWPPQRLARTCVASLCDSAAFAKIVAQEAYARHFFAAARRAFLGDGQKYNWSMQQKWFKDFEPITDFIHPLSYLYQTAMGAAGGAAEGWPLYVAWMTACWQGRVAWVLEELRGWQQRLGVQAPGPGPPEADVR